MKGRRQKRACIAIVAARNEPACCSYSSARLSSGRRLFPSTFVSLGLFDEIELTSIYAAIDPPDMDSKPVSAKTIRSSSTEAVSSDTANGGTPVLQKMGPDMRAASDGNVIVYEAAPVVDPLPKVMGKIGRTGEMTDPRLGMIVPKGTSGGDQKAKISLRYPKAENVQEEEEEEMSTGGEKEEEWVPREE